jgi:hypothetical protein
MSAAARRNRAFLILVIIMEFEGMAVVCAPRPGGRIAISMR